MKNPLTIGLLLLSLILFITGQTSCRQRDKLDPDPGALLAFSTDTLLFDTVFPTVGSITQRLTVYNPNKGKVNISNIFLGGGDASFYMLNIDGIPARQISDIEIPGEDSIFIFVRVTVDPNNQATPFIVSDSIVFRFNEGFQKVALVAWGRNAIFHRHETLSGIHTWDSIKAHVIYGSCRVDTGSSLLIMPGTRVYFHKDSHLAISYHSTLKVIGLLNQWVRFLGDRLDLYYKDLPGQWEGIFLEKGSYGNEINYALIGNGYYGLVIDSAETPNTPMLTLHNSIVWNMVADGINAYSSSIVSTNCVIGNCGGNSIYISGGNYDFRQLTLGNYWNSSVRLGGSLYLSNYSYDTLGNKHPSPLEKVYFGNSIIYGSEEEEIVFDTLSGTTNQFLFDHTLLKSKINIDDTRHFIFCSINTDPLFNDPSSCNYQLDTLSPVIGKGIPMGVEFDILGQFRPQTPALGAYEYKP